MEIASRLLPNDSCHLTPHNLPLALMIEMEDAPMGDSYTDMEMAQGAVDLYPVDMIEHVMHDDQDESIEVEMDTTAAEMIEYDMADEVLQEPAATVAPNVDHSIVPDPPTSPPQLRTPVSPVAYDPSQDIQLHASSRSIEPQTTEPVAPLSPTPYDPSQDTEPSSSRVLEPQTTEPVTSVFPAAYDPSQDARSPSSHAVEPQVTEPVTPVLPTAYDSSQDTRPPASPAIEPQMTEMVTPVLPTADDPSQDTRPPSSRPIESQTTEADAPVLSTAYDPPEETRLHPSSRAIEPQTTEAVIPVFISNPSSSSLSSFYLFSIPSGDVEEPTSPVVFFDDRADLFFQPLEHIFSDLRALGEELGIHKHTELSLTCDSLDLTITEASKSHLFLLSVKS
jgi:hypothetical protein